MARSSGSSSLQPAPPAGPRPGRQRARSNWARARAAWRKHGHEFDAHGRRYDGCFVAGAKFEWTTREVGLGVDWVATEQTQQAQLDNLLEQRSSLVDSLAHVNEQRERAGASERAAAEKKKSADAQQSVARTLLGLAGGRTPEPPTSSTKRTASAFARTLSPRRKDTPEKRASSAAEARPADSQKQLAQKHLKDQADRSLARNIAASTAGAAAAAEARSTIAAQVAWAEQATQVSPRRAAAHARKLQRELATAEAEEEAAASTAEEVKEGVEGLAAEGGRCAARRTRRMRDPTKLARRIQSVDLMVRGCVEQEERLHAITERPRLRRPSQRELTTTVLAAGKLTTSSRKLSTATEREERQVRRMETDLRKMTEEVQVPPPVESKARMVIREVQPLAAGKRPAAADITLTFTGAVEYPHYGNVTQIRGALARHVLTITEHSASRPWACVAALPNTYTIDLRRVDQLFYGGWPLPAQLDWETGVEIGAPNRPSYLVQSAFAAANSGLATEPPVDIFQGEFGRTSKTAGVPVGTVQRFARVPDWDRKATESVAAKRFFTPRIMRRMTSARQRHNESRAAASSWIRRNVKERERQARVAEAAVAEGAEIFQHFRRRNQQRTRANEEQKGLAGERTGGAEEERWGPKAQELMKRTSSRGESAAARDVASFRASQQKTSASSRVSYGQ